MNIAIIGYGKMGKMIEEIAKQRGHNVVCVIDKYNQQDFDSPAFASANVAIEFTEPDRAWANCNKAWAKNVKVVCGTTGWIDKHLQEAKQMCANEGKTLLWASNFSVGMAAFRAVNSYLARIMNKLNQYNIELREVHHLHKKDAPSGTAITLAEDIIKEIDRKEKWVKGVVIRDDENGPWRTGPHLGTCLVINSFRTEEVPGTHTIEYSSEADKIKIEHEAKNRKGFALGAVIAAEYTSEHSGFLNIEDVFNF